MTEEIRRIKLIWRALATAFYLLAIVGVALIYFGPFVLGFMALMGAAIAWIGWIQWVRKAEARYGIRARRICAHFRMWCATWRR